jgi:hypothetical protein
MKAAMGANSANITWDLPVTSIAALTAVQTAGNDRGSAFMVGTHLISYGVRISNDLDAFPLAACSFRVRLRGSTPPHIRCPTDRTFLTRGRRKSVKISLDPPIVSDNIGGATWVQTAGPSHNSDVVVGDYCVTYMATDSDGLTASCSQRVSAVSASGPARIVCPCDLTVAAEAGQSAVEVTYPEATTTTQGLKMWRSRGMESGVAFPIGVHEVAFQSPGTLCTFTVTVQDVTPPTIICPPTQMVEAPAGTGSAVVTFPLPNATDDNDGFEVFQTAGLPSRSVFSVGSTIITFAVMDVGGNIAKCSFKVLVQDTTPPTITCPPDVTAVLTPTAPTVVLTAPNVTDNRDSLEVMTRDSLPALAASSSLSFFLTRLSSATPWPLFCSPLGSSLT